MRAIGLVLTIPVEISQPLKVAGVRLWLRPVGREYKPAVRVWEFPAKSSQFNGGADRVVRQNQELDCP
jgi:hypothetical protein